VIHRIGSHSPGIAQEVELAEVLAEFDAPVVGSDGSAYRARACGAEMNDGSRHWMGWVEFVPTDGSSPVRSPRETTQPNRTDAVYWATGLTPIYLEGALERALRPVAIPPPVHAEPAFDAPAPDFVRAEEPAPPAVLDPFSVYEKGEPLLRRQLAAFAPWHLLNIIRAYDLSTEDPVTLERMSGPALIDMIVAAVRRRVRVT
jgi:hypothetical protein